MKFLTMLPYVYKPFFGKINSNKTESLQQRMTDYIKKSNSKKCHPYKPHIISLKSHNLLSYINNITTIDEKLYLFKKYNNVLIEVCKELYNTYDPSMIYCFNNEIHLVFYHNNTGDYLYNGDITKTLTSMASYVSILFTKKMEELNSDIIPIFSGILVEFDKEYETLNYIIWRQFDCKRNNTTLLYKCYNKDSLTNTDLYNVKIDYMLSRLDDIPPQLINGNIIKKQIYYTSINISEFYDRIDVTPKMVIKQEELVTRRDFNIEHIKLNEDFKKNMKKYIKNKLL